MATTTKLETTLKRLDEQQLVSYLRAFGAPPKSGTPKEMLIVDILRRAASKQIKNFTQLKQELRVFNQEG